MKFKLLRKDNYADDVLTKFHVLNSSGDIVGSISVPAEQADDLLAHWIAAPSPSPAPTGGKQNPMVSAMLAASRRPGAVEAARAKQENPMVSAMLRAAKQNTLNRQAILRSC